MNDGGAKARRVLHSSRVGRGLFEDALVAPEHSTPRRRKRLITPMAEVENVDCFQLRMVICRAASIAAQL